jgi:hypothetical protein
MISIAGKSKQGLAFVAIMILIPCDRHYAFGGIKDKLAIRLSSKRWILLNSYATKIAQ